MNLVNCNVVTTYSKIGNLETEDLSNDNQEPPIQIPYQEPILKEETSDRRRRYLTVNFKPSFERSRSIPSADPWKFPPTLALILGPNSDESISDSNLALSSQKLRASKQKSLPRTQPIPIPVTLPRKQSRRQSQIQLGSKSFSLDPLGFIEKDAAVSKTNAFTQGDAAFSKTNQE